MIYEISHKNLLDALHVAADGGRASAQTSAEIARAVLGHLVEKGKVYPA